MLSVSSGAVVREEDREPNNDLSIQVHKNIVRILSLLLFFSSYLVNISIIPFLHACIAIS